MTGLFTAVVLGFISSPALSSDNSAAQFGQALSPESIRAVEVPAAKAVKISEWPAPNAPCGGTNPSGHPYPAPQEESDAPPGQWISREDTIQSCFDGYSKFYVFNPFTGTKHSRQVSLHRSGHKILSGVTAAAFLSGDNLYVYDAERDSWKETQLSGLPDTHSDTAAGGTLLTVLREDRITIYDSQRGRLFTEVLSGNPREENTLVRGYDFVLVARRDYLYAYNGRNGRSEKLTMSGFPNLPNTAVSSRDLAAVYRGRDSLYVFDPARSGFQYQTLPGLPTLRLTQFYSNRGYVVIDREGNVTTYSAATGQFQNH